MAPSTITRVYRARGGSLKYPQTKSRYIQFRDGLGSATGDVGDKEKRNHEIVIKKAKKPKNNDGSGAVSNIIAVSSRTMYLTMIMVYDAPVRSIWKSEFL